MAELIKRHRCYRSGFVSSYNLLLCSWVMVSMLSSNKISISSGLYRLDNWNGWGFSAALQVQ